MGAAMLAREGAGMSLGWSGLAEIDAGEIVMRVRHGGSGLPIPLLHGCRRRPGGGASKTSKDGRSVALAEWQAVVA